MQKLEVYQSLWAMELRRPDGKERPLEESFEMVAAAGFDGMAIDLGVADLPIVLKARPLLERYGLGCSLIAFPKTIAALRPVLLTAKEIGAPFVNVIGQVMPISVDGAIPVIRRFLDIAEEIGVPIQFETHRNCITNDLLSTLQLLDAVPEMVVAADLSHYVVGRELAWPITAESEEWIRRILHRAGSFQGRVASRQQIQLPLGFPQHQKWLGLFLRWWEAGFREWRKRSGPDAALNFLCELGPPEYAMTGADGYELSDRWQEALALRDHARAIWAKLESEGASTG
jgi:hypothetical protein